MGQKNKFDWNKIGPPEDFQTDFSTQELLTQINEEISPNASPTSEYPLPLVSQIFEAHKKQDKVRVRISKQLYHKLLELQKQTNTRLSLSDFLDILFSKIFK